MTVWYDIFSRSQAGSWLLLTKIHDTYGLEAEAGVYVAGASVSAHSLSFNFARVLTGVADVGAPLAL